MVRHIAAATGLVYRDFLRRQHISGFASSTKSINVIVLDKEQNILMSTTLLQFHQLLL